MFVHVCQLHVLAHRCTLLHAKLMQISTYLILAEKYGRSADRGETDRQEKPGKSRKMEKLPEKKPDTATRQTKPAKLIKRTVSLMRLLAYPLIHYRVSVRATVAYLVGLPLRPLKLRYPSTAPGTVQQEFENQFGAKVGQCKGSKSDEAPSNHRVPAPTVAPASPQQGAEDQPGYAG